MLDRWHAREFRWASWDALGRSRLIDAPDRGHLAAVLAIADVQSIKSRNFKVVLDACHGAGGRMGRSLLEALGCRALVLGGEPDGRYDHAPEPTEVNLQEFGAVVPAVGAAVGFALDPDADRLAIVDEKGRYIGEELTLALAATRRLGQEKGPVILNLSTSRVTETLARAAGCVVFRTPVGEINVVQRMVDVNAILGGEGNGGVIDPRVGYVRDSFVGMAMVLDLMAATGEPLSNLVAGLPRYAMVKEQHPLAAGASSSAGSDDAAGVIAALWDRIADGWPDARADRRDGLRLDWDNRWVHVRASNTEPIVRVIAEAAELQAARELAAQVGRFVGSGAEGPP
jgi:phosphomannomutase